MNMISKKKNKKRNGKKMKILMPSTLLIPMENSGCEVM